MKKQSPPDPPEPVAQCWYCKEDLYPGPDGTIMKLQDMFLCGKDECLIAAGIEAGLDEEYIPMSDDYSFADFVRDDVHYHNSTGRFDSGKLKEDEKLIKPSGFHEDELMLEEMSDPFTNRFGKRAEVKLPSNM